mgnify:CR=1 FL=1
MDTCTVVEISLGDEYEILDAIIYNGKIYASVYNGTVAKIIEFSMSGNTGQLCVHYFSVIVIFASRKY